MYDIRACYSNTPRSLKKIIVLMLKKIAIVISKLANTHFMMILLSNIHMPRL